jgi:hypothetical protein
MMGGVAGASRPTLGAFFQQDDELRKCYAGWTACMATRQAEKARWNQAEFTEHLSAIGELVLAKCSVGRALVCGVAVRNGLMLVIGKSLPALFGIDLRQLHRWLGRIGWAPRKPTEIPYDQILNTFGPEIVPAAVLFDKSIQYRVYTGAPCWTSELDGPPEAPAEILEAHPNVALTESPIWVTNSPPDGGAELFGPIGEPPPGGPDSSLTPDLEAIEVIVPVQNEDEQDDRLTEYPGEFECELERRTCELREALAHAHETIEDQARQLDACRGEFESELDRQTCELKGALAQAEEIIEDQANQLGACRREFECELKQQTCELEDNLAEARATIEELVTRFANSETERNGLIGTLMHQNESLASKNWTQSSQIRALNSRITMLEQLLPNPPKRPPSPPDRGEITPSRVPEITDEHKQALFMFYNGHNLEGLCTVMDLPPSEVFQLLQSVIVAPSFQLPGAISVPDRWEIDKDLLLVATDEFQFLFSPTLRECFDRCQDAADFAALLVRAFADFSQQDEPDWSAMVIFVLEMAAKKVLRSGPQYEALDEMSLEEKLQRLEKQVAGLKSVKGKLLRDIRDRKETLLQYESEVRVRASRAKATREQERDSGLIDMNTVVSSDSPVRAAVFREWVEQAQNPGRRKYSDSIYDSAVVMMFRSRSTYEIVTDFAHLPAPSSIYRHFGPRIKQCRARLKSLDQVEPYLLSQIAHCPDIADGAVLAVDAVSCTNTFIGMKQVEEGKTAYLFVVYFQPLTPKTKCSPLFVIESTSGMAEDDIQIEIDKIVAIAQSAIKRVFLASDGDRSYNFRHYTFMEYWEAIFRAAGPASGAAFDAVLAALKFYAGVLPLSDLLHLAKNFRGRFLKYLLTFSNGRWSKSTSLKLMRDILGLVAPLADLTQVGKMRDAYPLVISRVEHMNQLFQRGAFAEAVAWLPLSLCFNAIRLENITRGTRGFMLRVGWFIVWHLYERKRMKLDKNPEMSKKKRKTVKLTIFPKGWSVRFLDTSLLITFSLDNYEFICLDRESTHPLENFFGFVRMDSDDINTGEHMTDTIAQTDIVKEAMGRLELTNKVQGRENLAGVHLTNVKPLKTVYDIALSTPMDPSDVAQLLLKSVHGLDKLTPEEQLGFQQFRNFLTLLETPARESRTSREIKQRFIVGSSSRIVRLLAVHNKSTSAKNVPRST